MLSEVLKSIRGYAADLARVGEVVAGEIEERRQVDLIKGYLEDNVDNVFLEPVDVLAWREDLCTVYVGDYQYLCSLHPPYSGYVEIDVSSGELVFLEDLNELGFIGDDIHDKVVVVEGFEDPNAVTIYAYNIRRFSPKAMIFVDRYDALRRIVVLDEIIPKYDFVQPPSIPAIHVPFRVGQALRKSDRVRIVAEASIRSSQGYNVIAEIHNAGSETIYIAAHHDHWFSTASDDILGVAVILGMLGSSIFRSVARRDIVLALFTAEEGFPDPLTSFYWLVGSRKHVATNSYKLLDEAPFVINIDAIYGRKLMFATSSLLLRGALLKLGVDTGNIEHDSVMYDSYAFTMLGLHSLTIHNYYELLKAGLYHSTLDTLEIIDIETIENTVNTLTSLIKWLDSMRDSEAVRLIRLGLRTLIREVVSKDIPLEIKLYLYRFFSKVLSGDISGNRLLGMLPPFQRLITSLHISRRVYEGRDIYEETSYVHCSDDYVHLFKAMMSREECFRNIANNLELLVYILQ